MMGEVTPQSEVSVPLQGDITKTGGSPITVVLTDDTLPLPEWDYAHLSQQQKQSYDRQERFLTRYAVCGTILHSGEDRNLVYYWQKVDTFGFNRRYELAQHAFRESLEHDLFEAVKNPKAHPVLRIFTVKGNYRSKYGDKLDVDSGELARDFIGELRKLSKEAKEGNDV